jgi:MIP family channel proteins
MYNTAKQALAEAIGTFTLTFVGAGAASMLPTEGATLVGVALAHGLALMVIIYTWGSISGAHVNPAVTLGVLAGGRIDFGKAVVYWIAQFAGAAIAGFLLVYLLTKHQVSQTEGSFTETDAVRAIVLEAILTFFLVSAVFASGVFNRNGNLAGVAIGLVLTMNILFCGPLTGASMNPARSFGPALAATDGKFLKNFLWIYFVGPGIGGVVAGLLYGRIFGPPSEAPAGRR